MIIPWIESSLIGRSGAACGEPVGLYGRPVGAILARDCRPPRLLRAVDATGVEEPPEIQLRKSDREG